jgi:hypothetical protein
LNKTIGIEAKPFISELPDFLQFLQSVAPPLLVQGNLFIYSSGNLANEAADLLHDAELLEEIHPLIRIDEGVPGADFFDYGFYADGASYMYIDQLSAFKISGSDNKQIEMALLQIDEHLTFRAAGEIFFIAEHYRELIMGIVRAYKVKVEFLDLDK